MKVNKDIIYTEIFGSMVLLPQFERKQDGKPQLVQGDKAPYTQLIDSNGNPLFSAANPAKVQIGGADTNIPVTLQPNILSEDGNRIKVDLDGATLEGVTLGDQQAKTVSVTFHDSVSVAGVGAPFIVSAYKTLTIEIYGTSTNREIKFFGIGTSGTKRSIQGVNMASFDMAISTTGSGEFWSFDITGLESIVMELTSVSGGNVTIKGKAVA